MPHTKFLTGLDLGVLVPIVAVRTAEQALRVRYGHRRTLAAITAGQSTVPVAVVGDEGADDADRLITQWHENEHRSGLTTAGLSIIRFGRKAYVVVCEVGCRP